jgi:signal peptidase I
MKRYAKRLLWLIGIGLGLFLIAKFVVTPYIVVGESMTPTLQSWDLCLMRRLYHYQPRRGDIVVFRTSDNPPLYFVKRVIALPGEKVAISNGVFLINGVGLVESYTTLNPDWQRETTTLPSDKIFVMGDNRELPLEYYPVPGPVATRLVQARMFWHWRWKR